MNSEISYLSFQALNSRRHAKWLYYNQRHRRSLQAVPGDYT